MTSSSPARRARTSAVAVLLSLALLAGACSSTESKRSASGAGDPTALPALAQVQTGSGDLVPDHPGVVLTPNSGVSTSFSPTLVVPGETGAWTFVVTDLSDGRSGFTRTYAQSGNSVRIPRGAGLLQDRVYQWRATSTAAPSKVFGGAFKVDVQSLDAQDSDSLGGISVGTASGEAYFTWNSHTMSTAGGPAGFGLRFTGSNVASDGVPQGWILGASTSAQFVRLDVRDDGSVGLIAPDGSVTNYQSTGSTWRPVQLSGRYQTTGTAPVLAQNVDGTWTVVTKQATEVFGAAQEGRAYLTGVSVNGKPTLGQSWDAGLLRTVSDPVSGRSIEFVYGGGKCPSIAPGFVAAPAGMLCAVRFWDGSTSAVSYVARADGSVSIGRITDFPEAGGDGAQVTDLAYDAVGRIARVREPLVAAAMAAKVIDVADDQYLGAVAYDDDGRVVSITAGAASQGGPRRMHTYDYVSPSTTTIADSLLGRVINETRYDPSTFLVLTTTDSTGLQATNEWDLATGNLLKAVDRNGNVTRNTFADGQLVLTQGPTEGSLAVDGPQIRYGYDQTFDLSPDGTPMRGLAVTYWSNAQWTGLDAGAENGPLVGGVLAPSLVMNWPSSPVGSAEWSARMTGVVQIAQKGEYTFTPGGAAKLWVENVACESGTGCTKLPLEAGAHTIRIDVSSTADAASMSVQWSGPDTGGSVQPVPTSALAPRYGFTTTAKRDDATAIGAPSESYTHTVYAEPGSGQASSVVTQSGAVSRAVYQRATGVDGEWGRQETSQLPAGNAYSFEYRGDREMAKAPCPGAARVSQGGQLKSIAAPGASGAGPTSENWFDAAGRQIATQYAGGAVSCISFDKGGRIATSEQLGMGSTRKVVYDYAVGGNPLVSETTTTIGSSVTKARLQVDLYGRAIDAVDGFGVRTTTTYDPATGNVATSTITAPGTAPVSTKTTYDQFGRVASASVDGETASVTYNSDGTTKSIAYSNGAVLTYAYDLSNLVSAMTWTLKDGTVHSSSLTRDRGSRVLAANWQSAGKTSQQTYVYDDARRLGTVTVAGDLTPAHTWTYTYDANSNRRSQSIDGATYTYTYNTADQLVSTTDPVASAGIEYDAAGNTTKVGGDSFTYDAASNLISATNGKRTIAYARDVAGGVLSKSITVDGATTTTQFASQGVTLDGEGRPIAMRASMPGGVLLTKWFDARPTTLQVNGIDANAFFTMGVDGKLTGPVKLFEPFGREITTSDPAPVGVADFAWQASNGIASDVLDATFQVMGQRVYMPALGRFLQVDPVVGGSANPYDYVNQDPVNSSDPTGASWSDWVAAAITAIVAIAVSAATGGLADIAAGAALAIGAVEGAVVAMAGYGINYAINKANDPTTEFNTMDFVVSALIGAVVGGVAGRAGWSRNRNAILREERANVQESIAGQAAKVNALKADLVEAKEFQSFLAKGAQANREGGGISFYMNRSLVPDNVAKIRRLEGEISKNTRALVKLNEQLNLLSRTNYRADFSAASAMLE